jgi:protein phosphatase
MGGHESGEVASRMAVDLFAEQAARATDALGGRTRKRSQLRAMAQDFVFEWTQEANAAIHRRGGGSSPGAPKARMGTTLALVYFVSDFVVVANVGDSRVYRVRGDAIEQLTQDHVIVADARRHAADPRPPRKRKFVTRALGTRSSVEPDIRLFDVAPSDVYVLCSDGLTDLVTDEEILATTRQAGVDRRLAVRLLIDLANKRGGPDNVTVVFAEVLGEVEDGADETDELPIL